METATGSENLDSSLARPILKLGHPLLRVKCAPVGDLGAAREIIAALKATIARVKRLYPFDRGCGLAAPQIGEALRIASVEYGDERHILINPEITKRSHELFPSREGCLSFFYARGVVDRSIEVTVRALSEGGSSYEFTARHDFAALVQHEIDH